ncbi:MAG TPA: ribosome-associated translation inhibitor RaiA [Microbacteriaceae bacterium]|nr:ribosome-associated translation inhibitor RaiA [Microbacteriaceae bacterium]
MELSIIGRNAGVTDRFREYVAEKSHKIGQLAENAHSVQVKLSRHHSTNGRSGPDRVEITVVRKGAPVRAEAEGSDKYAAFDVAQSRILERLRRAKDRSKDYRKGHGSLSLRDAVAHDFADVALSPIEGDALVSVATGATPAVEVEHVEETYSPVVIREKTFDGTPMTVTEALDAMELVGHDFYLFSDADSGRPSVVYRRKGWDYGVIHLNVVS